MPALAWLRAARGLLSSRCLCHHRALRRGRSRGGLSRAALRRRLPPLQGARPPLAVAVERERRLNGRSWEPGGPELRSDVFVLVLLAVALTACATIPSPQDANDAVLVLRKYDAWAWAVGIALIWADLVLPVPQTVV